MAVVSPYFLYIHPPKTGGIKVMLTMLALLPGARVVESPNVPHLPRRDCPPKYGRKVFSTARSPWTAYPSWYFHVLDGAEGGKEANWKILRAYGRGRTSFRDVLYGLTHPAEIGPMDNLGGFWPDASPENWMEWQRLEVGFWSYLCHYMWEGGLDALIATDRLMEGLETVLNLKIPDHSVKNDRRSKTSPYADVGYPMLYKRDMIEWVAEADAGYIDRFGFKPFMKSLQAVYLE